MNSPSHPRPVRWMLFAALCVGAVLLATGTAAVAQDQAQVNMRRDFQAQMNYIGWQQSQATATYIAVERDVVAEALAASIRAAAIDKIRKDATRDWWGVVAVSTDTGAWNVRLNQHSDTEAMMDAMKECKGTCSPVLTFANACMAPAYSGQGGMYWGQGESRKSAGTAAVQLCTAGGGKDCQSPEKESFCSGWKYAYSALDRFAHRANRVAKGEVAPARLIEFPGAKEYLAKPLERRGTSTAYEAAKAPTAESSNPWVAPRVEPRAEAFGRMAQPWTAIAAGGAPKAYAVHWGLNETDAKDTALSQCGGGDCKVVVAIPHGQCAAAIRVNRPGKTTLSFGGKGSTKEAAEEAAMEACIGSGVAACPVVFNECMK